MSQQAAQWLDLSAADGAARVRSRHESENHWIDAILQRYEEVKFGFSLTPSFRAEGARERSSVAMRRLDTVSSPETQLLAGVPIIVSDSINVAGMATTARCVQR